MKISNQFPALQRVNALFLVAGSQSAVIYRLREGELHDKETVQIEKPEYTDREGHFESVGPHGKLHGSGSVYEPKNEYMLKKFLSAVVDEIKKIRSPFDSIYLFAPMHMQKSIESALPNSISKKIKRTFSGNFIKEHPTALLRKVRSLREFKAKTAARKRVFGEAAKILASGGKSALGIRKRLY